MSFLSLTKRKRSSISTEYFLDKEQTTYGILKNFFINSLPCVLSCIIVHVIETINMIYAGQFEINGYRKEDVVNAVGIGNLFINLGGTYFGIGMITSLETLCSHAFGKKDRKEAYMWLKLCIYFITGYFCLFTILSFYSKIVLLFLGLNDNIAVISSYYIISFLPSVLFDFYVISYVAFLSSQDIFYIVLYTHIFCICLHPLWCYIFYIHLEYSVIGLGISSGITNFTILLTLFIYSKFIKKLEASVSIKEISWNDFKYFFKLALECGVLSAMDTIGFEIVCLMAVSLPQNELDANILVANIYNNFFSISTGLSITVTTAIGNCMGANKPDLAKKYSNLGISLSMFFIVIICMCLNIFNENIILICSYKFNLNVINVGFLDQQRKVDPATLKFPLAWERVLWQEEEGWE